MKNYVFIITFPNRNDPKMKPVRFIKQRINASNVSVMRNITIIPYQTILEYISK